MPPIHDNAQAMADATGRAFVTFYPSFDEDWYVERITANNDGVLTPDVFVYVGSIAPANLKDFSDGLLTNIADEASPIYVPGGSVLVLLWTGATVGSICTANIQYRPESLVVPQAALGELLASGVGVDGLLIDDRYPNQVRMPRAKR